METTDCARCGWPIDDPVEIVSRHASATGETLYTRCVCGLLRVWSRPRTTGRAGLVAQGARPAL